jgi:putative ABC transport system substrate-binding protein
MKRRTFIAGLGSAAAWPVVAWAQQGDRVRRIGVLMVGDENDKMRSELSAFAQALADLGWTDGHNVRMDLRSTGDENGMRALARELTGPSRCQLAGTPPSRAGLATPMTLARRGFTPAVTVSGASRVTSWSKPGRFDTVLARWRSHRASQWPEGWHWSIIGSRDICRIRWYLPPPFLTVGTCSDEPCHIAPMVGAGRDI